MEYRHFGSIGDILKHLMLCKFLKIEKPEIYCETNSAAADYKLDNGFNKKYGIIHFYNKSRDNFTELFDSEYIRILREFNDNHKILKYIGSPGLAFKLLGESCNEYFFCDLDKESLNNIKQFSRSLLQTSKIILHNGDGISGVENFVKTKPNEKLKNMFIHLDPYHPAENEFGTKTAFQLFIELANLGTKIMLWYGINTLHHRKQVVELLKKMRKETSKKIYTAETILNIISEPKIPINPGILGCGIIFCNLSNESHEITKKIGPLIEKVYEGSLIDGKFDGGLKFLYNKI